MNDLFPEFFTLSDRLEGGNPDKYLITLELAGFLPSQELSFCKQHNAEGK